MAEIGDLDQQFVAHVEAMSDDDVLALWERYTTESSETLTIPDETEGGRVYALMMMLVAAARVSLDDGMASRDAVEHLVLCSLLLGYRIGREQEE